MGRALEFCDDSELAAYSYGFNKSCFSFLVVLCEKFTMKEEIKEQWNKFGS